MHYFLFLINNNILLSFPTQPAPKHIIHAAKTIKVEHKLPCFDLSRISNLAMLYIETPPPFPHIILESKKPVPSTWPTSFSVSPSVCILGVVVAVCTQWVKLWPYSQPTWRHSALNSYREGENVYIQCIYKVYREPTWECRLENVVAAAKWALCSSC